MDEKSLESLRKLRIKEGFQLEQMAQTDGWQILKKWMKRQIQKAVDESLGKPMVEEDLSYYLKIKAEYQTYQAIIRAVEEKIKKKDRLLKKEKEKNE